jgi:hypothetical protein
MVWRLWYAFSIQNGAVKTKKENEEVVEVVVVVVVVVVVAMSDCGQNVQSSFINSKLKQWLPQCAPRILRDPRPVPRGSVETFQ